MKYFETLDCYFDDDLNIYCYPLPMDTRHPQGKLFRPFMRLESNGYYYIQLRGKHYLFHRVIAMAFIPNPNNLPQIDHINRIRTDNRIENLRWVTPKENNDNMGFVLEAQKRYGVKYCDDKIAYNKEYYKAHPGKHAECSRMYRKKMAAAGYRYLTQSNGKRKWVKQDA